MPTRSLPADIVLEHLLDAVCMVDAEGHFLSVSAAGQTIFGYSEAEMLGRRMIEFVHPADRERTLRAAAEIMAGKAKPHFENRYLRKDGEAVYLQWSARWLEDRQVRIAVARDITARKRVEARQAALYAISEAAHAAEDLVGLCAHIHRIIDGLLPAANFAVALYDAGREELSYPYHVDEKLPAPAPGPLPADSPTAEVIRRGRTLLLSPAACAEDESERPIYWLGVPLTVQRGSLGALVLRSYADGVHYTEVHRELLQFISHQIAAAIERKTLQQELHHAALYDPLTDLPNRALFRDRLLSALARARRGQQRFALFYLDLDHFKQVNDELGHAIGDLLLQTVAQRMRDALRESDTVARLAGDEFVVLMEGELSEKHALAAADKLRGAINRPVKLEEHWLTPSPSIGVAIFPQHGEDEHSLMLAGDRAMYQAKRAGGDRACLAEALEPQS